MDLEVYESEVRRLQAAVAAYDSGLVRPHGS